MLWKECLCPPQTPNFQCEEGEVQRGEPGIRLVPF